MHKYYDLTDEQQEKVDKVSLGYFICGDLDLDKAWESLTAQIKNREGDDEPDEDFVQCLEPFNFWSANRLVEEVVGFSASMLNFYIPEFEKVLKSIPKTDEHE